MFRSPLPGVLLLLLAACTETGLVKHEDLTTPDPRLIADPPSVDFGEVPISTPAVETVFLTNSGDVALTVDALTIEGASSFTITGTAPIGTLAPDETVEVWVTYSAAAIDEMSSLIVTSDDPAEPELAVPLRGSAAWPALVITPNPASFGTIDVGGSATEDLTLTNVGGDVLEVDSLVVIGSAFALAEDAAVPFTLAPGATRDVPVVFTSEEMGSFTGELWATTNALTPTTSAALAGWAGAGTIEGQVCAPGDGGWAVGARVWVAADVDGDGVEEWRIETLTDAEGRFTLELVPSGDYTVHVEKGSWSTTFEVHVYGGLTELSEPECLDPESVNVAVVTGEFDKIQLILAALDVDYDAFNSGTYLDLLLDPATLATYDIVFFDCGMAFSWMDDIDAVAANLAAYVEAGGSVYASDWAYGIVEATWPDAMDVYGDETLWDPADYDGSRLSPFVGAAGTLEADVEDATMEAVIGHATADINYDLDNWVVLTAAGEGSSVLLRGEIPLWNEGGSSTESVPDAPLAIRFQPGGTVIFTTFHNEAVMTSDVEVALEEIILSL